ncbi:RING-H2 finger protein ATL44 [Apostasia shenzhenica]|uniref:RING-H2 finger protein ATL44 n=1 Tax=Apostasia shenzhenica TaxID=1088818 RepID=A0A2I0B5N1_9ASPA|nr:RING-H2 finger protein ATL44 [Apostasia shenzhenica]
MAIVLSVVLLTAGIIVVVLIHVCVVGWTVGRFRRFASGEDCRNSGNGLPASELKKLPCYEYMAGEKGEGAGGQAECAVCLEGFQGGDRCRQLPSCGHSFHALCVDSWLMKSRVCPICRRSVCQRVGGSMFSGDCRSDSGGAGEMFELQEEAAVDPQRASSTLV